MEFELNGVPYKTYLDSETGRNYFVDVTSGASTWTDPRPLGRSTLFPLVVVPIALCVFFVWARFVAHRKVFPDWLTERLKPKKVRTKGACRGRTMHPSHARCRLESA